MKALLMSVVILGSASSAFSDPSEKEVLALLNKVEDRVAGGDVKALDELTKLPASYATPAFLNFFKQNYNIYGATATNKAIGLRAAQLATSVPGSEEYLDKLLKGKPANNYVFFQQDSAIKALIVVHNDISIRVLCGSLDDVDMEEIGPKVIRALTTLGPIGAPVSTKERISDTDASMKWKQWWIAHRADYQVK